MSRPHYVNNICAIFFCVLSACPLFAQAADPSINLTSPVRATVETAQDSITVRGTARADSPLANVRWVNQFGQRGTGSWTEIAAGTATWAAPRIALRIGVNLIAVTIVDAANQSVSIHLAVNRSPSTETVSRHSLPVGSGTFQNRPIAFQMWNGHAVVEGDILLDLSAFSRPGSANRAASTGRITRDGMAINYISQLWPRVGGVYQVPYIETGSSANLTTALSNFNAQFSGLIQFVPRASETNYVNMTVSVASGEGFSRVGMVGNEQVLDCGSGCSVATWLHEMGHTVGLLHEHQRPDRTNYITLNLANADLPNVPGNFTLFSYDYQTSGLYDYASVMHYCAFCFSKAGQPVLESVPAGIPLSNDLGYSAGDVDQIERVYGAAPAMVTVTTNPAGLRVVVDGVTYKAPQAFSFALNSVHTLALPADPQLTTPADGSTYAFGNWNDLGSVSHTITVQPGAGTLASPATKPAVTVYEANFVRLQPFAFLSPAAYPSGSGTVSVTPAPIAEFGGSFFVDRTLVSLQYTSNAGYDFYNWFNLPSPPSDNPHAFYIESPTTNAQAVFLPAAIPVTIVGESLTAPNTWNPALVGHVDGNFTLLPTGFSPFYDGPAWNAATVHSISVAQTQSPVTTNVYYDWNSWSDSGTITHNITQPSTGGQTITASFTPFYATYTVPPPLSSGNANCAGGVTTFPQGVVYPLNPTFGFYADGSSVMSTATANPVFAAMTFAGWTGSLSGTTNPLTITIHDQFVPTANFNVIPAPLAITSLTPALAVANPTAALDVTIKGSGFTANDTFIYWNGSFRANTYISSTQVTLHLTAGDLTVPGGQDIFVGNYTTNASNNTCSVSAETSFTVAATAGGGGVISAKLTPAAFAFTATRVGVTSIAQTATLKNTGTTTLNISSIAVQGAAASSFALSSNTCAATLAAAASCTFNVAFNPKATGTLTGAIAVTDNATGSPQLLTLKGTGLAPKVTLRPATLRFATTKVGSTSVAQNVTLKNTGTAALNIASILVGGANASSFILSSNTCAATLAAAGSCAFKLAFKPAVVGALTGTVAVTDDASGSPQKVSLHGTGN